MRDIEMEASLTCLNDLVYLRATLSGFASRGWGTATAL